MTIATAGPSGSTSFSFATLEFDHDPYPIGYAREVLPAADYRTLADEYPPVELFRFMPAHGKKYSLSEVNHPDRYHAFLAAHPRWHALYRAVKEERFVGDVLAALTAGGIATGLDERVAVVNDRWPRVRAKWAAALACLRGGKPDRVPIKTRFEFSMLPADGGHILPHTDSPQKLITLIVSFIRDGEWDDAFGGGTAVLRPTDPRHTYNHLNRYLEFDETEGVKTFPFVPNQCVLFLKTFNSLHAVRPMAGPAGVMRKTLTINIETY